MHHAGLCVQHVIQQSLIIGAGKRTHRIARRFRIICRRNLRAEIHAVNARGASANNIVLLVIAHHQRMLGGHGRTVVESLEGCSPGVPKEEKVGMK